MLRRYVASARCLLRIEIPKVSQSTVKRTVQIANAVKQLMTYFVMRPPKYNSTGVICHLIHF